MVTNREIADVLREMAVFYEMVDVPFKPAAYGKAADGVESFSEEAAAIYKKQGARGLRRIPGVGEGIARHIERFLAKKTFPEYAKFKKKYPVDVLDLVGIEGVGPKTVKLLYEKLKIKDIDDLERAVRARKLRGVPRLGAKTEANILGGIALKKRSGGRAILGHILPMAIRMEDELRGVPGVRHAVAAGSIRRRQETIGDLDILVTSSEPEKVMAAFTGFPEVARVLEHGPTKTVVRLMNGMRADVRVIADDSFGAALQYFTGSKEHNVAVRKMAIAAGLKLNEYGIWRGKKRVASKTEEDVYRALGLPYIEPELRTDSGEIEAAKKGKLPKVVPYGAVRGDLQLQTDWTDGAASIADMAEAARRLGQEYMAITDHTKSLAMAGGLDERGLAKQGKEIDRLNEKLRGDGSSFRVLKGSEVNVMKNGKLDIRDGALAKLDVVGIAVHSHFRIPRREQTRRVITAMKNPHADILFHPTGRKIGKRDPYDLDMETVLKAAKATGTAMEIDASPDRSDLKDAHVRMAVEMGVKLVIDSDSHDPQSMSWLDLGVAIARRGWATKKDVLNTRPLEDLKKWLKTAKNKRR